MTFENMQIELKDRLTVVSGDTFITDTMIKRWLNIGLHWALNYKRWPLLQKKFTDAIDATGTYPYQSNMKTKSCYLITVAGERYVKIRYEDYLKYLEDDSTGDDRVWSEFDRDIFINGNACTVGDAVIMFAYEDVTDLSAIGDTSPFASAEPAGDEAIIKYAEAIGIKKFGGSLTEARSAEMSAEAILASVWARISEAMPREVLKATPLFRRINILDGTTEDTDPNNIGNF